MYYERLIEKEIERKLKSSGAVLVAGPKFCGKTTTCMKYQLCETQHKASDSNGPYEPRRRSRWRDSTTH